MDRLTEYVIKHSACSMPRCEYVENGIEIDCDKCQEIMLKEHDAKVRTDAIDEFENKILGNCSVMLKDGERVIVIRQDVFKFVRDELKENK